MSLRFDEPGWLLTALLAPAAAAIAWRWFRGMSRWRAGLAALLRAVLIMLIAGTLAGASAVRTSDRLAAIVLVDVSDSVRRDAAGGALERARAWIAGAAERMAPDDELGVIAFAERAVALAPPTRGGLAAEDLTLDVRLGRGTDIAGAIELAAAMAPPGARTRLVLISDGVETAGDMAAKAGELAPLRIDSAPIEYRVSGDAIVEFVDAPPRAVKDASVLVRVGIRASGPLTGTLLLRSAGSWIDVNGAADGLGRRVDLHSGLNVELFDVKLDDRGVHRIEAVFEADDPLTDTVESNNSASAVVISPGRGRALLLDGAPPGASDTLAGVLRDTGMDVTTSAPGETPADLLELQAYDLIVLDNVAADTVPRAAHRSLAEFVEDLGGGLIVIGGPDALGAGGWNGTDLEPVLPVKLDLPEELIVPSAAIVMVIDSSGSMGQRVLGGSRTQQEIANEAAALAVQTLDRTDLVGVLGFADGPYTVLPLAPNTDPAGNGQRLRSIAPGGGTNLYPAIELAGAWLRGVEAEVKHVIVLSDGQSQGPPARGIQAAEQLADEGVTVTAIAVGDGADALTLESIANAGGGQFYRVVDPNVLPRVFVREIRIVRKPLIREEDFTPIVLPSGSPVTAGLGSPPALGGLVLTQPRTEPEIVLAMRTPTGEPLLAHWNKGLGRALVFTSDAYRWASRWLAWPGYRAMWTQAVRFAARPPLSQNAELDVNFDGDELVVHLDAAGEDGTPLDLLRVPVIVTGPDGARVPTRLTQTGPGQYEARVPAADSGAYVIAAMPRMGQQALAPVVVGTSKPAGPELRSLESDAPALRAIASATGGRVYDLDDPAGSAALWDRAGLVPVESAQPLWPLLLLWALGVFVADIAVRRVAWDRLLSREIAAARSTSDNAPRTSLAARWKTKRRPTEPAAAPAPAPSRGPGDRRRMIEDALREPEPKAPEPTEAAQEGSDPRRSLLEAKRRAEKRFEAGDEL